MMIWPDCTALKTPCSCINFPGSTKAVVTVIFPILKNTSQANKNTLISAVVYRSESNAGIFLYKPQRLKGCFNLKAS